MTGSLENIFQLSKVARVVLSSCLHQPSTTRSVYVTFTFPFGSVKDDFENKKKIVIAIGVRACGVGGGGGEEGCSPPKFWATQIFWAARENLGKASS